MLGCYKYLSNVNEFCVGQDSVVVVFVHRLCSEM